MLRTIFRTGLFIVLALAALGLGWAIYERVQETRQEKPASSGKKGDRAAPVDVALIERGAIESRRVFSGTLVANARFEVAPKIGGRIVRLSVDLADSVTRGAVVAELDNDEFLQAVAQAQADLAVSTANLNQAKAQLEIANRALTRVTALRQKGIASETQYDEAEAETLSAQAGVKVAQARVVRAQSEVETAKTRLGYTRVTADWSEGGEVRQVAQRFVEVGDTVAANAPLISIIELNPMKAVVSVAERDYSRLRVGQAATVRTDAFPNQQFKATVSRIAPAFQSASRTARVELAVENSARLLKPGMFSRAEIVFEKIENAVIVPDSALATRGGESGVFLVSEDGATVHWRPIQIGIRDGGRVQLAGSDLAGRVVTLGQQLIEDGSAIITTEATDPRKSTLR